jgi:uncharacterized protein (DUF362 family)
MAKSIVSIVKDPDIDKMVFETFNLLGGVSSLIKPNSIVVIKPNAGHPFPPETSVNTNIDLVSLVIKEIKKVQPKEIILAEASARGCDTLECLQVSGIGKAAEDAGATRIVDIKREKDLLRIPIRDARAAVTSVQLPRFLLEADHIINMPIFKSHVAMVFTCALKNIKGVVQDSVHYQMHQTDLAASVLDLWSVIKADLTIADLIRPAEGYGPHCTLPVDFGCVVGGKDPVAVDATACRMIGLPIEGVKYFEAARDRGFGNDREDMIEIRGKSVKEVYKKLWLPYLDEGMDHWPEYDIQAEGACSSCQGLLSFTMERLKAIGKYDENAGITICAGPKKELPKKDKDDIILLGDCLKKWRGFGVYISGCPPGERYPVKAITTRKDSDTIAKEPRNVETEAEEARQINEYVQLRKAEAAIKDSGKKPACWKD